MPDLLRTGLIVILLAAPLAVPLAGSRPAAQPMPAAAAVESFGMAQAVDVAVVHGIAINPRLIRSGGTLLVDGMPTNPAMPDKRPAAGR